MPAGPIPKRTFYAGPKGSGPPSTVPPKPAPAATPAPATPAPVTATPLKTPTRTPRRVVRVPVVPPSPKIYAPTLDQPKRVNVGALMLLMLFIVSNLMNGHFKTVAKVVTGQDKTQSDIDDAHQSFVLFSGELVLIFIAGVISETSDAGRSFVNMLAFAFWALFAVKNASYITGKIKKVTTTPHNNITGTGGGVTKV